ncbi:MAG: FAD-dependent oxidoreductase [Actinomycetota bacterium]
MASVVILGAGPAGLVAAADAARRGHDLVVLDRARAVGGMAASFEVAGVRVDHGSHRLHPAASAAALERLRRLLGDELTERPRNGRLRLDGRWLSFPLRSTELLTGTRPSFAIRAGLDAVTSPLRRARVDSYAEVVRAGLGPTVAERFHLPYARKLWGVDPDELSGDLARRRVSADSPTAILRRLLTTRGGRRPVFLYPTGGFGRIVERLADDALDAGAKLELEVEPTGIDVDGVVLADGSRRRADHVWSTIPPAALAALCGAPDDVRAAADSIRFRGLVLVYLVVPRRRWTPFDAHYVADGANPVARISEPRNYRDGDDPADRTVLCAELPATVGDELWSASDGELRDVVVDALVREDLPPPDPVHVEVRRLPTVYPLILRDTAEALDRLARWEAGNDLAVSFGRPALAVPDNTHHVIDMGQAIAARLGDDGSFDRGGWDEDLARFRTHVVED